MIKELFVMQDHSSARVKRELPKRDLHRERAEATKKALEGLNKEDTSEATKAFNLRTFGDLLRTQKRMAPRAEDPEEYDGDIEEIAEEVAAIPDDIPGELPSTKEEIPTLPPLEDPEDRIPVEIDPTEISGPRSIPPRPPEETQKGGEIQELRRKIAELHQDHKRLHEGHREVLEGLTQIVDTAVVHHPRTAETPAIHRRYAPLQPPPPPDWKYEPLEAPPARPSLREMASETISKIKGWWSKLTKSEPREPRPHKSEAGTTLRSLELAEQGIRDIPTLFLTGRTLDGTTVDTRTMTNEIRRFKENMKNVNSFLPRKDAPVIEQRRRALTGDSAHAIQKLLDSPSLEFELDAEDEATLLILSAELTKRIHSLQVITEQHRDPQERARADEKLRDLQKISGGSSAKQRIQGALLTCEAALRLNYAAIPDATRSDLSKEYEKRLGSIERTLGLSGKAREAIRSIQNRLKEEAFPAAA